MEVGFWLRGVRVVELGVGVFVGVWGSSVGVLRWVGRVGDGV